ncbi:MAG: HAMP domain-containing sensor histidine kinase [Rubrivivax sp.]
MKVAGGKPWQGAHAHWHRASYRWRYSIRRRLVALFLLLALAVSAVFLLGTQRLLKGGWQAWARPLVADYVDRLAAEIGDPPSKDRAIALAARLPISVRIEGPRMVFDTHPESRHGHDPEGAAEGWGLVRTTADGHRITFGLSQLPDSGRPRFVGWLTLAALLLLTAVAWAVVHGLLAPLAAIGAGAERFGQGRFDEPIRVRRADELGRLAERVNGMAKNLQGMLEAKRGLLLAISHELRSPLTRARLNAELVPESEARTALLRDLGEMRDLIADLLESERIAAGHAALHLEDCDVAALVREAAAAHPQGAALHLQLEDGVGPLRADPVRLKLLVRNLADNALRHNAGAANPPVVSFGRAGEDRVRIAVRDFGAGLTDEQIARLAEPFHRPDSARTRQGGGVGLGLYLCRLVAEAHGGRLEIRRANPGLEVTALWPLVRPQAGAENKGLDSAR